MALSRQFSALAKIAVVFASSWVVIGTAISVISGGPFLASLQTFGIMFGAVGGMSGLATGLLVSKTESGRTLDEVPAPRLALWGFLGGFSPGALFTTLALTPGGGVGVAVPMLILGLASGGFGAVVAGSAAAAAKQVTAGDGAENAN